MDAMKKNLLLAALILAAGTASAAETAAPELTDDEVKFQQALKESDLETYKKAVKFCDQDATKKAADRARCWRQYLAEMAKNYAEGTKTVDQQNPENSWTPLERSLIRMMSEDPKFKKTYDDMTAWVKDPKTTHRNKAGKYVQTFREPFQAMMKSYAANSATFQVAAHSANVIREADQQAREAVTNPNGIFHGDPSSDRGGGVQAPEPSDSDRQRAQSEINADSRGTGGTASATVPPLGRLTPTKAEAAPDKNKWNNEINGLKGGVWAGLIALILGGPAGALVFGAIGFGAFTAISKHNNA